MNTSSKSQTKTQFAISFNELNHDDTNIVGGKNASLGEMLQTLEAEGVRVPSGFATTSDAYRKFIDHNDIDQPMDMEWALDGSGDDEGKAVDSTKLTIVQARPETVQSQMVDSPLQSFQLKEKSEPLAQGLAIGQRIAKGKAFLLNSPDEIDRFEEGGVLVTDRTAPDWGPLMKRAAAMQPKRFPTAKRSRCLAPKARWALSTMVYWTSSKPKSTLTIFRTYRSRS